MKTKQLNRMTIRLLLLPVFFFLLNIHSVQAQKTKVDNVSYQLKENTIEISYDLDGKPYKNYKVSVMLRRELYPGFSFKPVSVKGDVGKGWFAGQNRKIIWDFKDEFKPEMQATDYFFEVTAKRPSKAWIFIVGGAALVGAGVATYFLLSNDDKESEPVLAFPIPVRP
jgi:hypothetical protein